MPSIINKYDKYSTLVRNRGTYIKKVPLEYLNKDIILLAVENNGLALNFVPDTFKNDEDIVLAAINQNPYAIEFASIEQKKKRNIIIRVVEQMDNSKILKYIDPSFYNDKEIILLAIKNNQKNCVLPYVSDELKNDFDIILAAVKKNAYALEYASDNLKNNYDIGIEAVKNIPCSIKFLSTELRNNPEIIKTAINYDINGECTIMRHASVYIRKRHDIGMLAVGKNCYNYNYLLNPLQSDKAIIFEALNNSLVILKSVLSKVKLNTEIFNHVVENMIKNPKRNHIIDEIYKLLEIDKISDLERIINLLKQDHNIFRFLSIELQNNNELILEALKYNINIYKSIPVNLLTDKFFMIKCYNSMGTCNKKLLEFLDEMLNNLYCQFTDSVKYWGGYSFSFPKLKENYTTLINGIEFLNEIDKINKNIYNLTFIKNNTEILHLLNKNIINYLIENKEYEVIYKNEELSNISKNEFNIIIMSNLDINLGNEYNSEELEILHKSIQKDLSRYKVFFI